MRPAKRSAALIVAGFATALAVPLLWLWSELREMRHELAAWKQEQLELVASRPTPDEVLRSSEPAFGSVIKGEDGSVELVFLTGPQWHYAVFHFDAGKAVKVEFEAKGPRINNLYIFLDSLA